MTFDFFTFYLIGALITITLITLVLRANREAYLAKHRKSVLVVTAIILTASSWIFVGSVIYNHVKRRLRKGV